MLYFLDSSDQKNLICQTYLVSPVGLQDLQVLQVLQVLVVQQKRFLEENREEYIKYAMQRH